MADDVKIKGPVEIQSDSKERVAYDLMVKISDWDNIPEAKKENKKYWLSLYLQCGRAVNC
ncbi:MAG: hypothetical protein PF441_03260 [Desulfuromusa sp.]|jgi:hypothetical protein|nr:hypothetical protein [Desulfuromusa sp.]